MIDFNRLAYSDFHMHTNFCDGKDSPEDMVLSAIDKGLTSVGVCCHSITQPNAEKVSMQSELKFKEVMQELKVKYAHKIKVYCGIEKDLYTTESAGGFDYVIGSMHLYKVKDKYYFIDWTKQLFMQWVKEVFNGDYYAMAQNYYSLFSDIVEKTNADIIGHIDLITKFNQDYELFDENDERYVNAYKMAVDKLIKYNKPFEINTGAISRGYRTTPYPSKQILDYIKERGGKVILSSDSHSKEGVAFEFDKWQNLLK